jgi:aerobactin synthase
MTVALAVSHPTHASETPFPTAAWDVVNRRLTAKMLAEYAFEGMLKPEADETHWVVHLASGVTYRFAAWRTVLDFLWIAPESIARASDSPSESGALDAAQALLDMRHELGMPPETLSIYLRELEATRLADLTLMARRTEVTAADLANMSPDVLDGYLDGHPKAPAAKGRIGWGQADHAAYAPEHGATVQPIWVAVDRTLCRIDALPGYDDAARLAASFNATARADLIADCARLGVDRERYVLVPVHPWQWTHMIVPGFAAEIASGAIRNLGQRGDAYRPLQSLRSLANAGHPTALSLKLPLTVLNTSAYRGVSGDHIAAGPALSQWLKARMADDSILAARGVRLQGEVAGISVPHKEVQRIDGVPYQWTETFGVLWRESAVAVASPGEWPVSIAALWTVGADGRSLAEVLIERSGMTVEAWLHRLFDRVVVPLWHMMCRYGLGFVAHGQNVTVAFRDGVPTRLIMKDLQGDLEQVDTPFPELDDLDPALRAGLKCKPAFMLVHNLLTAHVVTVLRFLSPVLAERVALPESRFYAILASVLDAYCEATPDLAERQKLFDLFAPRFARVTLNRARFAIGYSDAAQRPSPAAVGQLDNPIARYKTTERFREDAS